MDNSANPTYIPKLWPANQVWMIYQALGIDMLSRANHHGFGRHNIDQWRFPWICVRNPDRDGESVGRAAEVDGQSS